MRILQTACFNWLLWRRADADARDTFGNSPCHYAAEDGLADMVALLLNPVYGANVNINALVSMQGVAYKCEQFMYMCCTCTIMYMYMYMKFVHVPGM